MFCGKCGAKLSEREGVCPACGWRMSAPADDRTRVIEADDIRFDDKTVLIDSAEPLPSPRVPDNYDVEEPSSRAYNPQEYYPPAVPNYYNQPQDSQNDELIPQSYRSSNTAVKKKTKSRKPLVVVLVILLVLLAAAAGFFAWYFIWQNAPDTKISQAENAILSGDYEGGLSFIQGVDTTEADAVRGFVDLLRAKDTYAASYDKNKLYDSSDGVTDKVNTLITAFNGFHQADALPDGLRGKYDLYAGRLSACTQATTKLTLADLIDAQRSVLEFGNRKRGEVFKLADLESIVDLCSPAVDALARNVTDTDGYREFAGGADGAAAKTVSQFFTTVAAQLEQDKVDLESYRKSQNEDAEFSLTDKDPNYQASVADGLAVLESEQNMKDNADVVWNTLLAAWTAFAFEI